MFSTDYIDSITHKANQLEANDPLRRGLLEKIGDWWAERNPKRIEKIEREIEKRAKRLAY